MKRPLNIIGMLFGCWHDHLSFPRSTRPGQIRRGAVRQTGTYVVCLDCGKEFPYSWDEMRVLQENEQSKSTSVGWESKLETED